MFASFSSLLRKPLDEIIIVTTLDFRYSEGSQSERFFIDYKEQLKQRFEQLDILIIAQAVTKNRVVKASAFKREDETTLNFLWFDATKN